MVRFQVVYTGRQEVVPEGFSLIDRTPSGRVANLVPSGRGVFLAVRRQNASLLSEDPEESAYSLEPAVQDVSIVLSGRGESAPPGFTLIDKVSPSH